MSAEINMVNYVVCGIGVNVNTESFDDDIATRLLQCLSKAVTNMCETN